MPWLFSAIAVGTIIFSFKKPRLQKIILWVVLPQFLMLTFFCGWLSSIGLGITLLLKTLTGLGSLIMTGSLIVMLWVDKRRHAVSLRLACHILAIIIFSLSLYLLSPGFFSATQQADLRTQANRQLMQIEKGKEFEVIDAIDDPAILEEMLDIAVLRSDESETVIRLLTDRVESPFYFTTATDTQAAQNAPFFTAFNALNVTAIRLFSDALAGPSAQAEKNRRILRQDQRLLARGLREITLNGSPVAEADFMLISKMLLDKEPELLNEAAWRGVLRARYKAIIELFWRYRPPEKRENSVLALAIMGKTPQVIAQINNTPQILEKQSGPYSTLLSDIVYEAEPEVIQRIVNSGSVDWQRFVDRNGESKILGNALERVRENEESKVLSAQILQPILRGMIAQRALPEEQTTRYLSLDRRGILSDALSDAGLSCQQQKAMAEKVIVKVPHLRFDTRRICGPGRQIAEDDEYSQ
ncbi:Uncharacterised protein [Metakosakonia massiliensis]|uniref:Uncharacterized protein n=2 Tax=Phytobacter massiliensis TaxID=1485952 RepID=A0A6N2YN70_9ENTR